MGKIIERKHLIDSSFLVIRILRLVKKRPGFLKTNYSEKHNGLSKEDLLNYINTSYYPMNDEDLTLILNCAYNVGLLSKTIIYKDDTKREIDTEIYLWG